MSIDDVQLSRAISHALRHDPASYGLSLDAQGWTPLDDLIASLRRIRPEWAVLSPQDVELMHARAAKKRFEIADGRIRAMYGHSFAERIDRTPATPPDVLYHGTTPDAAAEIKQHGLLAMARQSVHLSIDEKTATIVAKRRTRSPVIIRVDAAAAHRESIAFYFASDGVWLAESIPAKFLDVGESGPRT